MADGPKNKTPKDPFDDIEEDKKESGRKRLESSEDDEPKTKLEPDKTDPKDILDKEESDDLDDSKEGYDLEEEREEKKEKFEELDEDVEEKPRATFISRKQDPEEEDKLKEHTLEDLANEDSEKESHQGGFSSYAKEDIKEHHNPIPRSNPLGSNLPNSGIYSSKKPNASGNKFHVLILIVIGLIVIGATVYLLKSNFTFPSSIIKSSPAPTEGTISTPAPTATPPSIDRSKFKIRVLNGTSTSGLAASEAAKLKNLGYQIDRSGNATNSAFTKTQVRAKPGDDTLIQQLISDLASIYKAASSSALKANDTADAEVILGKE